VRLAALLIAAVLAVGCAKRPLTPPPAPNVTARLDKADGLLVTGCFDCLDEALSEYDAVRLVPNLLPADANRAQVGAIRAALLLELRQRELGMANDGYLDRAKQLIGTDAVLGAQFAPHLYTIESIPWRAGRFNTPTDSDELRRMQELRKNFTALLDERRAAADADPLSAYAWLAFYCTHTSRLDDRSPATLRAPLLTLREASIVDYRAANCPTPETEPLTSLLEREPRYVEITYALAQAAQGRTQVEEAERLLGVAFKWRPRWPAVTAELGNVAFAFEENERALEFFDQTLAVAPDYPEALIGRIKALSLLNRATEAVQAIDALLAQPTRVFPGEAHYWRAWNQTQMQDLDQAWIDIEQATRLWVNSEVSKLGGLIAYRRLQRPAAIERFTMAQKLAPDDCENAYYLGIVHAELRDWPQTRTVFTSAAACIESAREGLRKEIAAIAASTWDPARKARQIARREAQITGAARMLVTSWFNMAVASYNLGQKEDARLYAERVVGDEQFAERAAEILKRVQ
jgi:tetratricopeptide (TPR) repeat protein